MEIRFFGKSDVGRKREKNEDSILVDESLGLFIVADGMGGHLGGEFASRLAVTTTQKAIKKFQEDPEMTLQLEASHRGDPGEHLRYAIRFSSKRIFDEASRVSNLRGMGTTIVALLIRGDKGYIGHVGDSRAYLIRQEGIEQLTVDHSLVEEQLQAGFITKDEMKNHKLKNIITRSVGFQDDVETDLMVRDLKSGEHYLLCSDGLSNLVPDQEIHKTVMQGRSRDPKAICEKLIEFANKKGGDDNVSVILVSIL